MFGFLKPKPKGKNKALNEAIRALRMNLENNYRDAAHQDFAALEALYESLVSAGRLPEAQAAFYKEQIDSFRAQLKGYSHDAQRATWD